MTERKTKKSEYEYTLKTKISINIYNYNIAINSKKYYLEYLKFEEILIKTISKFFVLSKVKNLRIFGGFFPVVDNWVYSLSEDFDKLSFEEQLRLNYRYSLSNIFSNEEIEFTLLYHLYNYDDQSFYFTTKIPIDTSFVDPEYFEVTCEITEVEE